MTSTSTTTDDSSSSGLLGSLGGMLKLADPQLLMSVGMGLMAGARYGSNAGEGLMQGMQMYQDLKTSQLQRQLMGQQLQTGQLNLQQRQMMLGAAQQALGQGTSGASPPAQGAPMGGPQAPPAAGATPQAPFLPGISPMPSAGGASPGTAAPQGLPAGLTPPTPEGIYGTTYPGMASPNYMRAMALFSQDPAAGLAKVREDQLKSAQLAGNPTIAKLDQLIKSSDPGKYMNGSAYSDIKGAWPQIAAAAGVDEKDLSPNNVRQGLSALRNQWSAALQEPGENAPQTLQTFKLPDGRTGQLDPVSGKLSVIEPSKLVQALGPNGQPMWVPEGQAAGMTPFNQVTYGNMAMSDPKVGALDAALTGLGINLPGNRNSGQYAQRLQNLIANNPDLTPQQLAQQVRTGQLDFNGAKRTTAQLSTLAGAADVQSRKIEKDLNSLGPIIQNLPSGPARLASIMTNLQKDWSWNGDKSSTEAVGYVKELAGEYAKLVSGSTGMAAPAEGEMKSALGLMQSALTQNGYAGMHDFLLQTSQNRRDAVREGLQSAAAPGAAVGGARTAPTSAHPPDIQDLLSKYGR